jgi:outer membrane protein assembly factor BamB
MAKRLFLIALLATAFAACKSSKGKGSDKESSMSGAAPTTAEMVGRDDTEMALMRLGIDGRVLRIDLNETEWKSGKVKVAQAHLLSSLLMLETGGETPRVFALNRDGLQPRWVSTIVEPTAFAATESPDAVLLTAPHHVTALEKATGRRSMRFTSGSLQGTRRPTLKLPFTPTGSAAGQIDTLYIPTLGAAGSNKNLESFSLVNGMRGWGYRASGDIRTAPVVAGDVGDPKLYFVTRSGLLTCIDAKNYGQRPAGPRWEELLEAGVAQGFFVTADSRDRAGGVYVVDDEGMVYCLDRVTGVRRWVSATGEAPQSGPQVFGNLCVLRMASGLLAFDKDNVVYRVDVVSGPDAGASKLVMSSGTLTVGSGPKADLRIGDTAIGAAHLTLEVQGEVLAGMCDGDATVTVDGNAMNRVSLYNGAEVSIGQSVLRITDTGSQPLWTGLDYDRIIGRVGNRLVAMKGSTLSVLDAATGEVIVGGVAIPGARLIPTNVEDGNLFVVGGDAVVYALFAR